uniref:recombinase family protein n=1 Tax=Dongia deserti TaxID=2268030 RepID=UPI00254791A1
YRCRQHGVRIVYCAEPFENDDGPLYAIVKAIKRAMAAEYSRELSVKVFQGLRNLAERGFDQGGVAPYGLKHILVDHQGGTIRDMPSGARKALTTDHKVLAPSLPAEVKVVKEIFRRCAVLGENTGRIARYLNDSGIPTRSGKRWWPSHIATILQNEKYMGAQVFNRTSAELGTKRIRNAPSEWIRKPGAFRGIVDLETFYQAMEVRRRQRTKLSDEELLSKLRKIIAKRGGVTVKLMRRYKSIPNPWRLLQTIWPHFGSI